jgi:acyl-coenzyme A synthetase/AMP-(fatty) acid ligase
LNNPIEYLIHWAKKSPEKIAIQNSASHFQYDQLLDRICRIAAKLKTLGIKPQQTVVLSMNEDHFRWIFSLALFHVGAIIIGARRFSPLQSKYETSYDWVITDTDIAEIPKEELILIDREWLASVKEFEQDMDFYHYQATDVICIFGTSGTTGTSKNVRWGTSHLEGRAKSEKLNTGSGKKLTLMNSTSNLGFYVGFSALMEGETLFTQGSDEEVIELIQQHPIRTLHGSPAQIASLIDTLKKREDLTLKGRVDRVITAGSVLSLSLLNNIQQLLDAKIYSDYGSTETGFACSNHITTAADLNSIGSPVSGVQIEIVDDNDSVISNGSLGKIRIKTPYMVQSYLNNDKETKTFFKDGWFYPGDYAFINDQGQISLAGRGAEVINLGGVKINQFLIDLFFFKYPGVKDAAVFTYQNAIGLDELAAAIVSDEPLNIDVLKEKLIEELGTGSCPKRFFRALNIPKNPNGKVAREQLAIEILQVENKSH